MQGLRRKMLLSILVFITGMLVSVEKTQAGDILPNYVPLQMSFTYYGSPVRWGSLSADLAIYVFQPKYRPEESGDSCGIKGPELFIPTPEDWKAFYEVCISADIWDLGKESRAISEDIVHTPMHSHYWLLSVNYPDRKLEIEGEEKYVDIDIARAMGLPGRDQEDDGIRFLISDKIEIVMKYEKVQAVWDALGEFLIKGNKFPLMRMY